MRPTSPLQLTRPLITLLPSNPTPEKKLIILFPSHQNKLLDDGIGRGTPLKTMVAPRCLMDISQMC